MFGQIQASNLTAVQFISSSVITVNTAETSPGCPYFSVNLKAGGYIGVTNNSVLNINDSYWNGVSPNVYSDAAGPIVNDDYYGCFYC
jgi:hypothetical protein